jgi:hypothetical protein
MSDQVISAETAEQRVIRVAVVPQEPEVTP